MLSTRKLGILLVILFAFSTFSPVNCQYGQGILSGEVYATAKTSAEAMRAWYKKNGSFPRTPSDIDSALRFVYTRVLGSPASPTQQIAYSGTKHSLGSLIMAYDPTIRNAPIDQWRIDPPETWNAPANSTVILTDGESQFLIWSSVLNGVPMRDSDNRCMLIYDNLSPNVPE